MKDPKTPLENKNPQKEDITLRDTAEYLQAIGPDGDDRDKDEIQEGLEEYGFDQFTEAHFESQVTAASDMPDWMSKEAKERANADYPHTENDDGMYDNEV